MSITNYKYLNNHELLIYVHKGDEQAFKYLYELFRPKIYSIAIQYLKSEELAKEVVQDVFLKIWLDRAELIQITSLEAWLYKVAKNNILNRLKRIGIEMKAKDYFSSHTALISYEMEYQLESKEYTSILQEVINALPEQQRKVFELARIQKLSYEKIGEQMNLSPLTVKTHMARALKAIRLKIHELGVDIPLFLFFLKDFF